MHFSIEEKSNYTLLTFTGRMMGSELQDFHNQVKQLIEKDRTVMIADLSEVTFLNSSGLGMLIAALTSLKKAGGDLILCSASEKIESLFRVSKLFSIFTYYDTLGEAEKAVSS